MYGFCLHIYTLYVHRRHLYLIDFQIVVNHFASKLFVNDVRKGIDRYTFFEFSI